MILYLNTTEKIAEIKLYDDKIRLIDQVSFDGSFILSEELVQRIDRLLIANKKSKQELTVIAVNEGPGSFTGLRIGVTTANFIAFGLNIPIIKIVNGDNLESALKQNLVKNIFVNPVMPIYLKSPHITKKN